MKNERPTSKLSLSFMARLVHLKPLLPSRTDVLDIGCGEGFISEILVKNGCQVTGIDYSASAIKRASKLPGEYIKVDFYNYKPKKKFSWIICSEVLEHLDDDKKALELMYLWLKREGRLLLSVPTFLTLTPKLKNIGGHQRHYSPEKLRELVKKVGFVVEKEKEWGCLMRRLILSYLPGISQGKPKKLLEIAGILLKPIILLDAWAWAFPDSIIMILKKPK